MKRWKPWMRAGQKGKIELLCNDVESGRIIEVRFRYNPGGRSSTHPRTSPACQCPNSVHDSGLVIISAKPGKPSDDFETHQMDDNSLAIASGGFSYTAQIMHCGMDR